MALSRDGINVRPRRRERRSRPDTLDRKVARLTVAQVVDLVESGEADRDAVLAAEAAGQDRVGVRDALADDDR